jgi:AcrR family transcriptional regulator
MQARETKRSEKKREVILDAAISHFNRKGVRGATLTEIAASVGLVTNSVTYYYRKKEDLAAACLIRTIHVLNSLIAKALREATPEQQLRTLWQLYANRLADGVSGTLSSMMSFNDIRALASPQAEEVFEEYNQMFRQLREIFQHLPTGLSRAEQNARTHLLLSTLHAAQDWLLYYEPEDYVRAADRIAGILLSGLGGRGLKWDEITAFVPPQIAEHDPAREAFLRASTRIINDQGYRGASVEKIAGELNVTKGSFYHHIESKDDLIVDCFERSFHVLRSAQDVAFASPGTGMERLISATGTLVGYQLSDNGPILRISAFNALPENLRDEMKDTMERLSRRFSEFVVEGMIDGSMRAMDPNVAAFLLYSMINAVIEVEWWVAGVSSREIADFYATPLFTGIFSGSATPQG